MEESEYRQQVFSFLERMPVGSVYVIDRICKAETRDVFIDLVKVFIMSTKTFYSYGVEFTNDYTRIRKTDVSGLPKLY